MKAVYVNAKLAEAKLNVQFVRAVVWPVQVAAVHDKLEDLLVGQALVRLLGQRAYLPQNDPK